MDFDIAVNKLARNHSNHVRRSRTSNVRTNARNRTSTHLSLRAKQEAEERKKRSESQKRQNQIQKNKLRQTYAYFNECERKLGVVKSFSSKNSNDGSLMLQPTSIHGDGDKIALPVSVLSTLMELKDQGHTTGSPFEFRVGILNPDYKFPMSESLKEIMDKMSGLDDDDHMMDYESDSDSEDEQDDNQSKISEDEPNKQSPFLDELACKYVAYTHCTVVEFTQEEGYIGLPKSIARALLHKNDSTKSIPVTRSVDPASCSIQKEEDEENEKKIEDDWDEDKTPGHLAWGAFDVPNLKVEIVLVNLPKGKGCTLIPSKESVMNGFHQLKDVKAVLEQSLIRTRATLSLHDTVHCWYRGKKFDLSVSSLLPPLFNAVSCINTDIEVNIGSIAKDENQSMKDPTSETQSKNTETLAVPSPIVGGRTLGSSNAPKNHNSQNPSPSPTDYSSIPLPPEPPSDQTSNTCTIQIRGDGKMGRRRFDITTNTLQHLFAYATSVVSDSNIRLVTRFPRRVFELKGHGDSSLKEAGIGEGQEMFMIEHL